MADPAAITETAHVSLAIFSAVTGPMGVAIVSLSLYIRSLLEKKELSDKDYAAAISALYKEHAAEIKTMNAQTREEDKQTVLVLSAVSQGMTKAENDPRPTVSLETIKANNILLQQILKKCETCPKGGVL